MENIVIKVQKNYFLKKIYANLTRNAKIFYLLDSYTCVEETDKTFRELKNILVNKEYLKNVENFLCAIYRYYGVDEMIAPRINAQKFLIAWLITSFPEFVLNIKRPNQFKDEYPIDIYFICQDVITNTQILSNRSEKQTLRKFIKSFNKYTNAINYFLQKDKHDHIYKLIDEFCDLNKTIEQIKISKKYTDDEKTKSINIISQTKNKLIGHLNKMDKTIWPEHLEIISQIKCKVKENMEKAMFDILLEDVKSKRLIYFENLMKEIKKLLIILGVGMDSDLDNEFMQHVRYGKISYGRVLYYGDYLIAIINKLYGIGDVDDTWEQIKNENCELNIFLTKMIIHVIRRLHG